MYTILKSIPHRQVEEMQRQVTVTMSNEEKTTLKTTYLLTLVAVFGSLNFLLCSVQILKKF